jgi:hypothetical protein
MLRSIAAPSDHHSFYTFDSAAMRLEAWGRPTLRDARTKVRARRTIMAGALLRVRRRENTARAAT